MGEFEDKREKALELYHQNKLNIVDHALERMIERSIRITFIIKENLLIITVIREQE
ncbi:MAG: hypothetical protein OIN87_10755 [Candidatus Methanoperedens sp.]|nr:hypothetical protein [Candidatus Methanoperedens sp.]